MAGGLGGALNAWLIARMNFPPLIVTLGTFSLFRGLAEGLTRGIENYSSFPARFLYLGQGYLFGVIPAQLPILIIAIVAFGWMLHRTAFGRTLYAIGFSAEGAANAGVESSVVTEKPSQRECRLPASPCSLSTDHRATYVTRTLGCIRSCLMACPRKGSP